MLAFHLDNNELSEPEETETDLETVDDPANFAGTVYI
jgi:hypothetical protein